MGERPIAANDGADPALEALSERFRGARRVVALTGAGVSTDSGIPDYRDAEGGWKHRRPIQYRAFMDRSAARQRYWARSMAGWPRMRDATPNLAHQALTRLEHAGALHYVITQNVDGLHQRAGSRRVIDLHGRLDTVACQDCGQRLHRDAIQELLQAANPGLDPGVEALAPDGDAELAAGAAAGFQVPHCPACGGLFKPEVVFFGERVPAATVADAFARLDEADLLLVAGSSLMVWSGYRFVRHAAAAGIPVAIIGHGRTRGDPEATFRVHGACGTLLDALARDRGA